MRVSKNITIHLPSNLKNALDNYLKLNPPTFKYTNDQFYYLLHLLIKKQIRDPKKEYVSINNKDTKAAVGTNIRKYLKILEDGEFIISDKKYIPQKKSFWYKLNVKENDTLQEVIINHKSIVAQKIIKRTRLNKTHHNRLEPHLKLMRDKFMKLELDYEAARNWVENNAQTTIRKLSYHTSLSLLEDKRFRYFKRNKTNSRLDTNLTNLKSDLRQFINGDYVSIDLKNSQPFLLGILTKVLINNNSTLCNLLSPPFLTQTFGVKSLQEISKIRQKQDFAKMATLSEYLNLVTDGELYNDFKSLYSKNLTRKEVKDIMFKVLFSKNKISSGPKIFVPYKEEKQIFESVFPLVYKIVEILKSKDHTKLPIFLQQLESYVFIDCLAKELTEIGIIPFTIHDSIIVEPEHLKKVVEIINKVFLRELGVEPSFDIQSLHKEPKICPITRVNISMQQDDSFLLSHTGLKYLYNNDRKLFEQIKQKYLYKKYKNTDFNTQIKEIAHGIRDKRRNQLVKYPLHQKRLFNINLML